MDGAGHHGWGDCRITLFRDGGLPDNIARASKDRVKEEGSGFDLPIAVGILAALEVVNSTRAEAMTPIRASLEQDYRSITEQSIPRRPAQGHPSAPGGPARETPLSRHLAETA